MMRSGRDRELARSLPPTVDPVLRDGGADRVEVLLAQALQRRQLVGPARQSVAEAVRQAGAAETAVAAARRVPTGRRLQNHHIERWAALLGSKRGPQPGVTTTDDSQIRLLIPDELRGWFRRCRV